MEELQLYPLGPSNPRKLPVTLQKPKDQCRPGSLRPVSLYRGQLWAECRMWRNGDGSLRSGPLWPGCLGAQSMPRYRETQTWGTVKSGSGETLEERLFT